MRLLVLLFILLAPGLVKAQDVITTIYGDTLHNKIIYSTKRYLFYVDSTSYGKYFVRGIKKTRIADSEMNVYKADRYLAEINERARDVMANPYMLQGGVQVSYIPFIPDSEATTSEKKFYRKLSVGISYNLSFHYRVRPYSFIGIVFDDNRNTAFADKLDIKDESGDTIHLESIEATLSMTYIGPEFMMFRSFNKFKSFFTLSGGIGYARAKWSIKSPSRSKETIDFSGFGIRISASRLWAVGRTFIIGPNAKFVNVLAGDKEAGLVMIPRLNLGVTVLLH
jgi:hypothetical protein